MADKIDSYLSFGQRGIKLANGRNQTLTAQGKDTPNLTTHRLCAASSAQLLGA
jgi:hypothetical protein